MSMEYTRPAKPSASLKPLPMMCGPLGVAWSQDRPGSNPAADSPQIRHVPRCAAIASV